MIVDLTVDGILDFFVEFYPLERGNKGNPLGSGAFFQVLIAGANFSPKNQLF